MWAWILFGLIMFFVYPPIAVVSILIGLIVWVSGKRKQESIYKKRERLRKEGYYVEPETKKCPRCAEEIKYEAKICKYCSCDLSKD